ncbi:acyl carrier protein [Polynucleobacter sp. AP-Feld-500C-C5]|uniref:acyl carrier protein n=1 Tax=Polynucleobacter sp. AP-Feld-500C-C5 TaxID=2576924 RepID=UPI001C0BCB9B|nr:acyl carrier protein [Polynucleobacter sp. AP-Feld-500C-C5]MBU3633170.1 acyl carrier protein [Polynucleobacter sp. AP-Feld-500C-C5]
MSQEAIFLEHFINAVDFQDPVPITLEAELKSLPEWDSLAALGVIVMFDMEYSKVITGDDLSKCLKIIDIFNYTK